MGSMLGSMLADMLDPLPVKINNWYIVECDYIWKMGRKLPKELEGEEENSMVVIDVRKSEPWQNGFGAYLKRFKNLNKEKL